MTTCILCNIKDVYMYIRFPGTEKFICVPCLSQCINLYNKYIGDVAHKAKKIHPSIHEHRKIEDPDQPSKNQI